MPTEAASVRAIFDHAVEITSDAERSAYLDSACADLPDLRREVNPGRECQRAREDPSQRRRRCGPP